jgi:hypothetical protein
MCLIFMLERGSRRTLIGCRFQDFEGKRLSDNSVLRIGRQVFIKFPRVHTEPLPHSDQTRVMLLMMTREICSAAFPTK